jgi:cell division protein FtsI (penicillin-binding protein 3)
MTNAHSKAETPAKPRVRSSSVVASTKRASAAPTATKPSVRSAAPLRIATSPSQPPPARPRRRLLGLAIAMLVVFGLLGIRLVDLQVVNRDSYAQRGTAQRKIAVALAADRGSIFDRNGTDLALSVPARTIYADPKFVTDPDAEANAMAPLLGVDAAIIREKLAQSDKRFVYVARKVDLLIADQIKALELPGINFVSESKRYYPGGDLAAPVMGFVGTDNNGLSGLETAFDKQLTGKPGQLVMEQDPQQREIPTSKRTEVSPVRGQDLVLTLDQSVQYEAERVLTEEVAQTKAKGGMAMIADVKTGEILAMVSINGATDTTPAKAAGPTDRNRNVTDAYEPGSTNKVITMAGAIEAGVTTPTTPYQVPMMIKVGDATFEDSHDHGMMAWNPTDILRQSSNVGTIMIGRQLGKTKLDQYLRAFGFGKTTSLGLPGETPGLLLSPDKYSATSMGTVPTGNGLAVSPAQMLSVYMTVANGGVQVPLRVVSSTIDSAGARKVVGSTEGQRVISEATSAQLRTMLAQVVQDGTGTLAAIPGYTVAGKTGTARKPPYDHPPYRYMASFAGFAPADNPRLASIVILDEPQTEIFGGRVAAPAFSRMMAYALRAAKVPPNAAADATPVVNATPAVPAPASPAGTNATPAATPTSSPTSPSTTRPRSGTGGRTPPTSLAPTPRASTAPSPNG